VQLKFGEIRKHIFATGLGEAARFKQDAVEITDYVTPYELVYKPSSEVSSMFSSDEEVDSDGNLVGFQEQLMRIGADVTLFEVWARDQPEDWREGSTLKHIANVKTNTPLTTSMFGDQKLFF